MATFEEFIASIQADGNDGKAFEHFCKWFLLNDPYWKTQVDKAWLFSEWPDRWGPDNGIDLIFKHKNGEMWAVQAKCYDAKHRVSKPDMDSFLTESNRAVINHRLLLASTNIIGPNAQRACVGQEKPVTLYLLKDFEAAQVEYPSHISELTSAKTKAKPVPDPHQTRAITDVVSKFGDHDRGQLIMACGTGKTFTTLWIKEALAAQTTLVLVPSLNLLSQTLNEWAFAAKDSFDVLCVCSDKTVGKRDKEDMALGEAPFSVTSDLSVISDFISNDGHKVIFCTYQSSDLIAEVQSDKSINPFDLVIADEAHRCSGKSDAAFSKVLDDEAIRATKRLFTTATPRLYSSSVKKAAADRGIEVYGMDDEAVFGPVLHTLTFGQAIAEDLLNDYQVVIVGVDQPMIKEWIENQELLGVNPNNVTDARTLAAKIGLLKAIKDYDLTRVISFHSRVNAARDFAAEVSELVDLIEPSNRPKGTLWSSFVSGSMRTTDRIIEIGKLKSLESADIGLLANARCLSEGVDVPSLDGIAFIDPRGSQVDIIQAVGRAIRKIRGASTQTKGTIVLPVFIEDGDDAEAQIEASDFKPVWDVLKALRSHDEVLADHLDQYRTNMAKGSGTARQTLDDRIIFDLPITVDPNFSSALSTVLVEATTASWQFWFGLLEEYVEEFGDALVPDKFDYRNKKLGTWISNIRRRKDRLNDNHIRKLEALSGWSWDPLDDNWNQHFQALSLFLKDHDIFDLKQDLIFTGLRLGQWVQVQRTNKRKMTNIRKTLLEGLPSWVWNTLESRWDGMFHLLQTYLRENKYIYPSSTEVYEGERLGQWVQVQRSANKKLPQERRYRISQLRNWTWDKREAAWQAHYADLCNFVSKNKRMPLDKEELGHWISRQRRRFKQGKLSLERIKLLEKLEDWTWDAKEEQAIQFFEQGFLVLLSYFQRYQTANISYEEIIDDFPIGKWVNSIRQKRNKLHPHQTEKLEQLSGWTWNAVENLWEINYLALKKYAEREGSADPPQRHSEEGINIGTWVSRQRAQYKKSKLSKKRISSLEKLPNWTWDASERAAHMQTKG